jgi:hypothetical protein
VLLALGCTFGLILLLRSFYSPGIGSFAAQRVVSASSGEIPDQSRFPSVAWSQLVSEPDSEPNVLELPRASFDFVGNWGGYTHTGSSDVEGSDHVSVVFGSRRDSVFFASKLYTLSDQMILDRPRATIVDRRKIFVTYKAQDKSFEYIYLHRFNLLNSGKIAYSERVECYDRRTHRNVGTAEQDGTLHRLTTVLEERAFAHASSSDVFAGELSTTSRLRPR